MSWVGPRTAAFLDGLLLSDAIQLPPATEIQRKPQSTLHFYLNALLSYLLSLYFSDWSGCLTSG